MKIGLSTSALLIQAGVAASSFVRPLQTIRGTAVGPKVDGSRYMKARPVFDRILPKIEGPRHELKYANRRTITRRALEGIFGREHKVYSALGLAANSYSILMALTHYAMQVGVGEFVSQFRRHATTDDHIPVHENDFIEIARRHYLEGIDRYARALSLDVSIEGTEKLPKDGTVFVLSANHASIFSDFLFAWADPAAVPVAAAENFSDAPSVRKSGAGLFFDLMGLPMIRRAGGKNGGSVERAKVSASDVMSLRLMELIKEHGTMPIYFGQGGRVPTAYDDYGLRAKAGFYSNVPDPLEPHTYFQAGAVILTAWRHAKRTGSDVSLALMSLTGTERVMPKHVARKFPFYGQTRIGERIQYRIVDVLKISPKERRLREVAKRAVRLLKDDIGIDAYLEGVVARWAKLCGKPELADDFLAAAAEDETYLIVADRIHSFNPANRWEQRRGFVEELVGCLEQHVSTGKLPKERLERLLAEVSVPM